MLSRNDGVSRINNFLGKSWIFVVFVEKSSDTDISAIIFTVSLIVVLSFYLSRVIWISRCYHGIFNNNADVIYRLWKRQKMLIVPMEIVGFMTSLNEQCEDLLSGI